jgi:Protein of unknown function (DUF2934)
VNQVPLSQLAVVPYLDIANIGGRRVNLMALWDGVRWHMWIPTPAGLINMHPVEAMHVDYVAKAPARPNDLLIPFVELMWQRLSYDDICPLTSAICDTFHKMGTSVAKLRHTFASRATLGHAASDFASLEVEYVAILARTVYDLLQEALARIWKKYVRLNDPDAEKRRNGAQLPPTFSRVVLRDKSVPRDAEEIATKFGLPLPLASTYAQLAPAFGALREMRDRVIHSGTGARRVYTTERGFCVEPNDGAFRGFQWSEAHRHNDNLVSVLPWIANVVLQTIGACNALMSSFAAILELLPELAPGYRIFVRGPSTDALLDVLAVFQGGSPWWSDAEVDAAAAEQRIRERAYYLWQQRPRGVGDAEADWRTAEQIERDR